MANFFQKIARFLRGKPLSAPSATDFRTYVSAGRILDGTSSRGALTVAAVYRCIKVISESVAQLPLRVQIRRGDIFRDATSHHLYNLLTVQPCMRYSAYDMLRVAVQYIITQGNAYIVPVYGADARIEKLILCNSGTVSHQINPEKYIVNDPDQGLVGLILEPGEIIHLKGLGNGTDGVSVLTYASSVINTAKAGDDETYKRFARGGNVRGMITNPTPGTHGMSVYQPQQLQGVASDLDERLNEAGERIVAIPGMGDFKQFSLSSTDMQFLETRKFTVREICRMFGVPPSFVFDDTSNNYKSVEMANTAFLSNTLNPILCQIENELLRKLISPEMWHVFRFRFDRSQLNAADLESRMRYLTQALGAGIYTVNELRAMEGREPVEGGDTPLASANLKTLTQLQNGNDANT